MKFCIDDGSKNGSLFGGADLMSDAGTESTEKVTSTVSTPPPPTATSSSSTVTSANLISLSVPNLTSGANQRENEELESNQESNAGSAADVTTGITWESLNRGNNISSQASNPAAKSNTSKAKALSICEWKILRVQF